MKFVSYSAQLVYESKTSVSNVFINDYLPFCNGDCARVYLYGLYVCSSPSRHDNTLDHFARNLNMTEDDVLSAFTYWQDQGLVQILSTEPMQIKFLPVTKSNAKIKKYATGKWDEFNAQMQAVIDGRQITPNEFLEYYTFLETFGMEPDALILIADYCVKFKGSNVGWAYIIAVAKNWAYSGIKNVQAVREKLQTDSAEATVIQQILRAAGQKRNSEPDDFEYHTKWTQKLGFSLETILHVAKKLKKSMSRLDTQLLKYFELKMFEIPEIDNYEKSKHDLVALAYAVNKKIGVYYENVESIVENYITAWQLKGFESDTILAVATFCFKSGIRTLEGMDKVIERFYKAGVTTVDAIDGFIHEKVAADKVIKDLLEKLNITRAPNQIDRDFYLTWTQTWGFGQDIIEYVAGISADKISPMAYMNKILASFFANKVTTLEAAKNQTKDGQSPIKEKKFIRHSYKDGELNRLFSNLDEDLF